MMIRRNNFANRRGTAIIETAMVLPVFILLLFAILEYGRFMMVRHVIDHASREGARYAVVHTADQTEAQILAYTLDRMPVRARQFTGAPTIILYQADATGEPLAGANWDDTKFGSSIGVRITANYKVLLGGLLGLPTSFLVSSTSLMRSEAN